MTEHKLRRVRTRAYHDGLSGRSRTSAFLNDAEMDAYFAGFMSGASKRRAMTARIDLRGSNPAIM